MMISEHANVSRYTYERFFVGVVEMTSPVSASITLMPSIEMLISTSAGSTFWLCACKYQHKL